MRYVLIISLFIFVLVGCGQPSNATPLDSKLPQLVIVLSGSCYMSVGISKGGIDRYSDIITYNDLRGDIYTTIAGTLIIRDASNEEIAVYQNATTVNEARASLYALVQRNGSIQPLPELCQNTEE
jgi:hypothetical protein